MATAVPGDVLNVRDEIAKKTERITVFLLAVLGLVYGFFYLPEPVLALFKDRFHSIGGVLANMGFSAMIGVTIGTIIMAQDVLATTKLKSAKFFRGEYPSETIKNHYRCDQSGADYLWFLFFNPWRERNHPRHLSYVLTFQRSYACRFIFHARWSLAFFTIVAATTWFASWYFQFEETSNKSLVFARQYTRAFLLILAVLIAAILFACNRLKPTGCWALWREINNIHKKWLEDAVFRNATTYQDALNLLQDPKWKEKWGYSA